MSEEVPAFFWLEERADVAGGVPERFVGSRAGSAQVGFELRERHFYRIEIGGVGRQEQEPRATLGKHSFGLGGIVHLEIVENDDIARRQRRGELRFDIDIKSDAVHGAGNDPRGRQPRAPQAGNERLVGPVSMRDGTRQACAFRRAASEPRKLGVG